jgi:hypothetical protein
MLPYVFSICFICSTKYLDLKIGAYQLAHIKSPLPCCAVCWGLLCPVCCIFSPFSGWNNSFDFLFRFVSFPLLLLFSFSGFWMKNLDSGVAMTLMWSESESSYLPAWNLEVSLCPKCSWSRIRNNDCLIQTDSAQLNCDSNSTDLISKNGDDLFLPTAYDEADGET